MRVQCSYSILKGFESQNVLVSFLFSTMKHSYLLTVKIANGGSFIWKHMVHWDIECFNATLDYKVIYPDGTSDYIIKDDFGGVQVIPLQLNISKKYKPLSF